MNSGEPCLRLFPPFPEILSLVQKCCSLSGIMVTIIMSVNHWEFTCPWYEIKQLDTLSQLSQELYEVGNAIITKASNLRFREAESGAHVQS